MNAMNVKTADEKRRNGRGREVGDEREKQRSEKQ